MVQRGLGGRRFVVGQRTRGTLEGSSAIRQNRNLYRFLRARKLGRPCKFSPRLADAETWVDADIQTRDFPLRGLAARGPVVALAAERQTGTFIGRWFSLEALTCYIALFGTTRLITGGRRSSRACYGLALHLQGNFMSLVTHSQQNPGREDRKKTPQPTVQGGGTLNRITGVQLLATGSFAPSNIVPNQALAELGYDAEWIVQRTGIRARRHAEAGTATSELAVQAALNCLEQAEAAADDLDMILVATMTPDTPTPSTACHVQHALHCGAAAMDINAACAGFMYALVTGMHFVQSGAFRRVLVIGADMMSRTVNPADQKTYPLFGDGAGAVLLGPAKGETGLLSYILGADGSGGELLQIPAGGTREPLTEESMAAGRQFLHMDGRAVFKWAVRTLQESVEEVVVAAGVSIMDIDLAVFHQANTRILDAAAEALGLPKSKVFANLDQYGNTSAASIPLALDEAVRAGRIQRGNHIVMSGFGAGLAYGAGVLKW